MDKKLYLEFKNADGQKMSIALDNPKDGLDQETVTAEMTKIIDAGVFQVKDGDITSPSKAYTVEKQRVDILG